MGVFPVALRQVEKSFFFYDVDELHMGFGKMVAAVWQWQASRDGNVHHEMCGAPFRLLRVSPEMFPSRTMRIRR